MFKRATAQILLFACLLDAQPALAFFDSPSIAPASPSAGQPVTMSIREGGCDAIAERPGFPQITQAGNAIRILEYGHHWDFEDFCIYKPATVTHQIGTFPPGDYTLTVDVTYADFLPAPVVVTLGTVPFTVTGQPTTAAPVPALGFAHVLALGALMTVLAFFALRTRRARDRPQASSTGETMSKHGLAAVFASLCLLAAQNSHAYFDAPYITPANPQAGDAIVMNLFGGVCDTEIGWPGYPQITQSGNAIRIVIYTVHANNIEFCNLGVGTSHDTIGTYAAGTYWVDPDFSDG